MRSTQMVAIFPWIALTLFAGGSQTRNEGPLTTDEACELLVAHQLHEAFDGWAMRFQYVVWCNRNDQDDIAVTITLANGQSGSRSDPIMIERMARQRVEALLERKQWKNRYSKLMVQVVP